EAAIAIRAVSVPFRAPGLVGRAIIIVAIIGAGRARFANDVCGLRLVIAGLRCQCAAEQGAGCEANDAGSYRIAVGALVMMVVILAVIAMATPVPRFGGGQCAQHNRGDRRRQYAGLEKSVHDGLLFEAPPPVSVR